MKRVQKKKQGWGKKKKKESKNTPKNQKMGREAGEKEKLHCRRSEGRRRGCRYEGGAD